jgi:two-component system, LytTR family, response regulator
MTVWDSRQGGRWKHRREWDCRSRANVSSVTIRVEIAVSLCGHVAEAELRLRFRCRYDLQKSEPVAQTGGQIRVLVVDDEAPARQRLIDLLRKDLQIGRILEAVNGKAAVEIIGHEALDLVFLDVQMPELDGLQVIETVGATAMPLTVFVTAYDQHAIRAFEANALDYLLKPFSDERWEAALDRAKTRHDELGLREFGRNVARVLATQSQPGRYLDRLVVKGSGTTRFIRVADIDWIEGAGVYVNLHTAGKELLYRSALNELADRLDPMRFIRVHRSSIVNIDSVLELQPISHGEFQVVLKDGHRSRVSRTYRVQLEKRLGQSL